MKPSGVFDLTDDYLTRLAKVAVDVILCTAAMVVAYSLRFSTSTVLFYMTRQYELLMLTVGLQILGLTLLGVYSAMWRYTSLYTFFKLASVTALSLVIAGSAPHLFEFHGLPRSVIVLDWFLVNFFCAGARLSVRKFHLMKAVRSRSQEPEQRILIYGAGNAGELMLRSIETTADIHIDVVGFVDDRASKQGLTIHGRKVLGTGRDLGRLIKENSVSAIYVAIPSLSGQRFRALLERVRQQTGNHVQIRTLPGVLRLANGLVSIDQIRKVEIADLLRRERVQLDEGIVRELLQARTVMVVGGGGSIGSEL
jgi:FlaA1/EpsC-like NDP-sugar epimerase